MRTRTGLEAVDAAAASEWDYASIGEISQALQSRRISASELLDHTIARIEALDQRLNSIVVRTFDLARNAAKAADAALPRGDRATIAFAELVAREFGGFVPPPMSSL